MNRSTVLTDDEIRPVVAALQTQVHRDWAPAWGTDADLTFVPTAGQPEPGAWQLILLDDSDQASALGYHDLSSEGLPLGKIFARTDHAAGLQWSVTASHEMVEMLADPDINLTAFVQSSATKGTLYAYESADACEADQYGYAIDGVQVSDFVFPAWFESFRKSGSTQFDFGRHITAPFQLLPGGYISVYDIRSGSGWHQLTAASAPLQYAARPRVGSRRERRRVPRDQWLLSTAS
ncbi:hypothetical protein AB0N05_35595 [Nocardia sp. NPDC051030]|uniref:hypothetical protein n=1 Tax=Nocardia sp. NPDC051030 TaxID=3155162 RepID=UPI003418C6E2